MQSNPRQAKRILFALAQKDLISVGSRFRRGSEGVAASRRYFAIVLGAHLALVAMAFHSLGDFNLQIPATTWMLGALTGLGIAFATRAPERLRAEGE